ncbi:MAG TPA: site-specific DNA-methyltransferase [Chryseosolibacter sp.]|nr:site-specific DNA-methyltransferase [Chryseosolibacter sp.]
MNEHLKNKIICADAFETLKQIENASIECAILDLPYNMCTTEKDWDNHVIDLNKLWQELKRITTPTANIIFFGSQPFTSKVVMSNPKWFRYEIIWQKNIHSNPGNAKKHHLKTHENILVFYKKFGTYNPQGLIELDKPVLKSNSKKNRRIKHLNGINEFYYQTQTNYPKSVQQFNVERGKHGSQKSVKLLEYLIETFSNERETILDITAGSFSLAVAAQNTNRDWICCEREQEFCDVGKERFVVGQIIL